MIITIVIIISYQVAQLTQFDDELYKVVGKRSEDEKDAEVGMINAYTLISLNVFRKMIDCFGL